MPTGHMTQVKNSRGHSIGEFYQSGKREFTARWFGDPFISEMFKTSLAAENWIRRKESGSSKRVIKEVDDSSSLSAAERRALERLAAGYGYEQRGKVWVPTGGPYIEIPVGVMSRLYRRRFVTFVGVIPGTGPAITPNGRAVLGA